MSPGGRKRLFFVVRLAITAGLFGYLLHTIDLAEFRAALQALPMWAALALLVTMFGSAALGVERWRLLLMVFAAPRIPSRLRLLQLYLVGAFYNTFVPGGLGGDLVRGVGTREAFGPSGATAGLAVVFVERVMGLTGLLVVVSVSALLWPVADLPFLELLGVAGLLGAVAAVLGLFWGRRLAHLLPAPLAAIAQRLPVAQRVGPFGPVLLLSVLVHGSIAAGTHLLLSEAAPQLPLQTSLSIMPLAVATIFLPISVGGAGVFEASVVSLYAGVGVPQSAALAACVGFRIAQLTVAGAGGLVSVAWPVFEQGDGAQAPTGGG